MFLLFVKFLFVFLFSYSFIIFQVPGYASCCVGDWSSDCYFNQGDYNFNNRCKDFTDGYCENSCEYLNGSYDEIYAPLSEACATCCREALRILHWKCDNASGKKENGLNLLYNLSYFI